MRKPRAQSSASPKSVGTAAQELLVQLTKRVEALEAPKRQLLDETDHSATAVAALGETVKYAIVGCGAICFAVAGFTASIYQVDTAFSFNYAFFSTASIASGLVAVVLGVPIRGEYENIESRLRLLKIEFAAGDRQGINETKADIDKRTSAFSFRYSQWLIAFPAITSAICAAFAFGEIAF